MSKILLSNCLYCGYTSCPLYDKDSVGYCDVFFTRYTLKVLDEIEL